MTSHTKVIREKKSLCRAHVKEFPWVNPEYRVPGTQGNLSTVPISPYPVLVRWPRYTRARSGVLLNYVCNIPRSFTKDCDPGTRENNRIECLACTKGFYQPNKGNDTCPSCAVGEITIDPGQTSCIECDAGKRENNRIECLVWLGFLHRLSRRGPAASWQAPVPLVASLRSRARCRWQSSALPRARRETHLPPPSQ